MRCTCLLVGLALMTGLIAGAEESTSLDVRGGIVAFYSNRDGDTEIFIMNADVSGLRQLTDNDCSDDVPALPPDGRFIAFASDRKGNPELFVMDLAGLSVRQLTETFMVETHPDWSPDGTQLAFVRFASGTGSDGDIFLIDVQTGVERRVTTHPANDMRPAWFADGARLLFSSNRDGDYEIYEMAIDGTGLRRLTNTASSRAIEPAITRSSA
jgi:Tol biopolymer transport system component